LRKINKGSEPEFFADWKKENPIGGYKNLSGEVRRNLNQVNISEQFAICAYCCKRIDTSNSMNEHVEARALAPNWQLDFSNIVASCTTPNQCDSAHKSKLLPLTPLMDECEAELKFYLSGRVEGLSGRASESIKVLNLDNRSLRGCRKQALDALLYGCGSSPEEIELLDDDLIDIMIEELKEVGEDNLLAPYSPVLVNTLSYIKA